jgi:predicted nucleic acid-binding protein
MTAAPLTDEEIAYVIDRFLASHPWVEARIQSASGAAEAAGRLARGSAALVAPDMLLAAGGLEERRACDDRRGDGDEPPARLA